MTITQKVLISLGFVKDAARRTHYTYKGLSGDLIEKAGLFYFHAISPAACTVTDLKSLVMLIDSREQAHYAPIRLNDRHVRTQRISPVM